MKLMAEGWTEERLDDLKGQVERLERRTDEGFRSLHAEMDRRFDQTEAQIDARFEAVDRRFEGIDRRFEALDGHLYAMHRTLTLFLGSMFAALLGFLATQL